MAVWVWNWAGVVLFNFLFHPVTSLCFFLLICFNGFQINLKSGINVEWKESSKIRLISSIFFFPSIKWLTIEISQSGSLRSTPSSSKSRYQFCSLWNLGPEILGNCLISQGSLWPCRHRQLFLLESVTIETQIQIIAFFFFSERGKETEEHQSVVQIKAGH